MKTPGRRWHLLLVMLLGLLNTAFGPPILREKDIGGIRLFPWQIRAMAGTVPPQIEAEAYLLADYTTGRIILAHNEHRPLPPASLTKIMTALLTLERSSPDETVTISERALRVEGTKLGLRAGEEISVKDLLYGLLLLSANDAAVALAEHVAGTEEDFVALMNARAAELGMEDTRFVNPHGLDAPEHHSSAYDLWLLTRYALANPIFALIVATPRYSIGGYSFASINRFLELYPGADGVKTGTTERAGECLIASATREGHRGVVVLLNSPDRYGEAASLLDYYFQNYALLELDAGPAPLNLWEAPDGVLYKLELGERGFMLLERWEFPLVRAFRLVQGRGINPSEPIGKLNLYLGDGLLETRPLFARRVK